MNELLIRGRVLTFLAEPQGIDDTAAGRYIEDGAVFVRVALASCSKSPSCASSARQASLAPWAFNSRAPAST